MSSAALYAGAEGIRHAFFVAFVFKSPQPTLYVWNGFRTIDLAGQTWQPVGPNATVTQMEDPISDAAPSLTLRVSGVDTSLLALALSETDYIRGQLAFIYDQYFDETWTPIGAFENYAVARLDNVQVKRNAAADGSWERTIEIPAEYFLVNGPNPVAGRYSFEDQEYRISSGIVEGSSPDNYFNYIPALQNKVVRWPTF